MFLIVLLAKIYIMIIIVQVLLSWLVAFEIVNKENEAARNLMQALAKFTDPVYTPLRKYIPPIANMDLTPLVVIIAIQLVVGLLGNLLY